MSTPLTTQQKATAFRAASAITYLAVTIRSFHSAFRGLIHFAVAIAMCVAAVAMLIVQVWQLAGRPALPIIDKLDDMNFGNGGENVFSFRGRCLVDLVLGLVLIFYLHDIVLGIVVLALIGCVVAFKDRESELFTEVFGGGGSEGIPSPADASMVQGAYQSV